MNAKAMRIKVRHSVVDHPIPRSAISFHAHAPCAERPFTIKRAIIRAVALVGMLTLFIMPVNAAVSGWVVEGFGDFNRDGNTDVFWRNFTTGATSAWLMDGDRVATFANYGAVSDALTAYMRDCQSRGVPIPPRLGPQDGRDEMGLPRTIVPEPTW